MIEFAPNSIGKADSAGSVPSGGAVYGSGDVTFHKCSFTDNSAYYGGAVATSGKLTVEQSTMERNSATTGGAVYITRFADVKTEGVTFQNNKGSFAYPVLTDPAIANTHAGNVIGTAYTAPFEHAFNNYDIAPQLRGDDAFAMGAQYYQVVLAAGENGSLHAPQNVPPFLQANIDLTAGDLAGAEPTADPGYAFAHWELPDGAEAVLPIQMKKDVHLTARFAKVPTLTFETNGGSAVAPISAAAGTIVTLDQTTAQDGYEFTGWYGEPELTTKLQEITLDTDKTVYAGWRKKSTGGGSGGGTGGSAASYTVTFETNGGSPVAKIRKAAGTKLTLDQRTSREGYVFTGWYADQALGEQITEVELTANITVFAGWRKTGILNTDPKLGYMNGYEGDVFMPDAAISRAEVAAIFYRLLSDQEAKDARTFADVQGDEWYATPVLVLASKGILVGDNGIFRPKDSITRAEFVTALSRLIPEEATEDKSVFSDVAPTHWAAEAISRVSALGMIHGYPDATFRPDGKTTRAEAAVMVNRLLGRMPDKQYIDMGIGVRDFRDVPKAYWGYYEIQAAVNGVRTD